MEKIDYLVIGHVSCDRTPSGCQVGGTVSFAGRTAQALGCRTAVLTSAAPDYDLSRAMAGMALHCVPATETTTFANEYTPSGRVQTIYGQANPLTATDVPDAWQRATVVHLAPLCREVNPEMIHLFSNSLVGVTPQGWLRRWDENGRVYAQAWPEAEAILPLAGAVILSEEDLLDMAMLEQYRQWSRLLVLTQGKRGCTVFLDGETRRVPAPRVTEVEPTGAGDVFAAAFLVRLYQTAGNPWEAARFANQVASQSVTKDGLDAKIACIQDSMRVSR